MSATKICFLAPFFFLLSVESSPLKSTFIATPLGSAANPIPNKFPGIVSYGPIFINTVVGGITADKVTFTSKPEGTNCGNNKTKSEPLFTPEVPLFNGPEIQEEYSNGCGTTEDPPINKQEVEKRPPVYSAEPEKMPSCLYPKSQKNPQLNEPEVQGNPQVNQPEIQEKQLLNDPETQEDHSMNEPDTEEESPLNEPEVQGNPQVNQPEIQEKQLLDDLEIQEDQSMNKPDIQEEPPLNEPDIEEKSLLNEPDIEEKSPLNESDIEEGLPLNEPEAQEEQPLNELEIPEEQPSNESDVHGDSLLNEPDIREESPLNKPEVQEEQKDQPMNESDIQEVSPLNEPDIEEKLPLNEPDIEEDLPLDEPEVQEEQPLNEQEIPEEQSLNEPDIGKESPLNEPEVQEEQPMKESNSQEEPPSNEPEIQENSQLNESEMPGSIPDEIVEKALSQELPPFSDPQVSTEIPNNPETPFVALNACKPQVFDLEDATQEVNLPIEVPETESRPENDENCEDYEQGPTQDDTGPKEDDELEVPATLPEEGEDMTTSPMTGQELGSDEYNDVGKPEESPEMQEPENVNTQDMAEQSENDEMGEEGNQVLSSGEPTVQPFVFSGLPQQESASEDQITPDESDASSFGKLCSSRNFIQRKANNGGFVQFLFNLLRQSKLTIPHFLRSNVLEKRILHDGTSKGMFQSKGENPKKYSSKRKDTFVPFLLKSLTQEKLARPNSIRMNTLEEQIMRAGMPSPNQVYANVENWGNSQVNSFRTAPELTSDAVLMAELADLENERVDVVKSLTGIIEEMKELRDRVEEEDEDEEDIRPYEIALAENMGKYVRMGKFNGKFRDFLQSIRQGEMNAGTDWTGNSANSKRRMKVLRRVSARRMEPEMIPFVGEIVEGEW